jgi:hypothetical protein
VDRNGKKPKAPRSEASLHAERSDTKANSRDVLGRVDGGAGTRGGKGPGNVQGTPSTPGRKGPRG